MAKGSMSRRGLKSRSGFTGSFNGARAARQRKRTAIARKQRGFVRTGGFFGRFNGRGAELKFFDLDLNDALIASGGSITDSLVKIPQGTEESQRIGRRATVRSINWRFDIQLGAQTAASATLDIVRIILYLDKQTNGAAATVTSVLNTADYQSFNNLGNKSRFRTLMDRTYDINLEAGGGDGTTEDYGATILSDTFFKRVNIPIEWDSTAGAITEIRSNNLGVLLISKADLATFASKIRIRYSDL